MTRPGADWYVLDRENGRKMRANRYLNACGDIDPRRTRFTWEEAERVRDGWNRVYRRRGLVTVYETDIFEVKLAPDARKGMVMMDLMDYKTGSRIRAASLEEWRASVEASRRDGGAGVIDVDGCPCYVEGNPAAPDGPEVGKEMS